jgi:hypothetical protein
MLTQQPSGELKILFIYFSVYLSIYLSVEAKLIRPPRCLFISILKSNIIYLKNNRNVLNNILKSENETQAINSTAAVTS